MRSATRMNQLLRNLCHHSMWKYALLWKFQYENSMILTCEDSYAVDTKSDTAMEYASYEEFISRHPWECSARSGNNPDCSIIVAVCNMTRISYLLGEGIVGKVASMENHQWICVEEMNYDLLLENPEEFGLQVAAGIKTILFLPLLPLGLVQLGSLDKLSEDLTMVAELKDLFCPYQCTSMSGLRMEQTDSSMTLSWPSFTKLIDPIQSRPLTTPDFSTLSFDQMMVNKLLPLGSVLFHHRAPQSHRPLAQDGLYQVHELDTDFFYENSCSTMCSQLFEDHSEEQRMINASAFIERTIGSDQSSYNHKSEVKTIPVIGQRLASKNTTVFDPCVFNKAYLAFVDDNNKYMDFSVKAVVDSKNSEWMSNKSKGDEGGEMITIFNEERPEVFEFSDMEPCLFLNENRADYLSTISDGKELKSCDCAKSRCSSCRRCPGSCIRRKAEDVSNSEDSGLSSRDFSSLISDSEGFKPHPTTCQSKASIYFSPNNIDEKGNACGFWRSCLKESHIRYRQTKNKNLNKPRPRDRQLIQDRIRELRELIPNSLKCSVDALLQRTVDHMMFLRSIPVHANKLSQSARPKVEGKDLNVESTQVPQTVPTWTYEVGNKSVTFPLIIENLDQPDQMLVEMQCRSYRLFLEIAQAIKHLGLTTLKGILETRSEELWAHFIVEIPKGFHRVDIIWPLMQLQQLKW